VVKTHLRAVKKDYETVEQHIQKGTNTLKEDLEAEIIAYGDIHVEEVQELVALENSLQESDFPLMQASRSKMTSHRFNFMSFAFP
jgi:hypothetical protein